MLQVGSIEVVDTDDDDVDSRITHLPAWGAQDGYLPHPLGEDTDGHDGLSLLERGVDSRRAAR